MNAVPHQSVARCGDGESVFKVRLEKAANVDRNVTLSRNTSLSLDVFDQFVVSCCYQ